MSQLYFRYGVMDSSKSANLIMAVHNYRSKGDDVLVFKPCTDTRSAKGYIESRVGVKTECVDIEPKDSILTYVISEKGKGRTISCVFVDEVQFLTEKQVNELHVIVDVFNIPVLAYGLRTDFASRLFPASAVLMSHADKIEEIKTICHVNGCNKKATHNQRLVNGQPVYEGEAVVVEGSNNKITYESKCRKHYMEGLTKIYGRKK